MDVHQVPLSRPSESIQVSDPTSISTAIGQSVHLHPCRLGSGVPCLVAPYVLDVIPDGETAFAVPEAETKVREGQRKTRPPSPSLPLGLPQGGASPRTGSIWGWGTQGCNQLWLVLEKILKSPLDCKEIKPVNPKGNQS